MKRSLVTVMTVSFALSASAAPAENPIVNLTRNAQSGLVSQSQLLANAYRQEAYQDNYTVQVPYQTTETYTVDVPYQDTETYYTSENVCSDYTDYERRCEVRRQCDFADNIDVSALLIGRPGGPGGGGGGIPGGGGPRPPAPAPRPPAPAPAPRPPAPAPAPRPPAPAPRPPAPAPRPPAPAPRPPAPAPRPPSPPPAPPRPPSPPPRPPSPPPSNPGNPGGGGPHPGNPGGGNPGGGGPHPGNPGGGNPGNPGNPGGPGHGPGPGPGGPGGPGHGPGPGPGGPGGPGHGPGPGPGGPGGPGHGPGPGPGGPDHGGGPRPPNCHDVQVCEDVPVTRQRCEIEQVAHTRYVTHYRQETRTREVTKYRDEERCCVTKYNTVFDHQWGLQVNIQFPQGTELQGNETESFEVDLIGTEDAPDVTLKPLQTIYGYTVASKVIAQGVATIVLQQVPRYKAADMQQTSIQALQVVPNQTGGLAYKFQDNALFPHVSSTQQLLVVDATSNEILAQTTETAITQRDNSANLAINWDMARSYVAVLKVKRTGSVIENGGVDFEVRQPLTLKIDTDALKSDAKITTTVKGSAAAAILNLRDDTVPYSSVVTEYKVSIARRDKEGNRVYIGNKVLQRTALTAQADGSYVMPVSDFVKASDLTAYIKTGVRLVVTVEVTRTTQDGKKINFKKDNRIVVL